MKAVRLVKPGQTLEMQEVTVPHCGVNDVLVKVKADDLEAFGPDVRTVITP